MWGNVRGMFVFLLFIWWHKTITYMQIKKKYIPFILFMDGGDIIRKNKFFEKKRIGLSSKK